MTFHQSDFYSILVNSINNSPFWKTVNSAPPSIAQILPCCKTASRSGTIFSEIAYRRCEAGGAAVFLSQRRDTYYTYALVTRYLFCRYFRVKCNRHQCNQREMKRKILSGLFGKPAKCFLTYQKRYFATE